MNTLLRIISSGLEALDEGAASRDRQTLIAGAPSGVDDAAAHLGRHTIYADETPVAAVDLDLKAELNAACELIGRGSCQPSFSRLIAGAPHPGSVPIPSCAEMQ